MSKKRDDQKRRSAERRAYTVTCAVLALALLGLGGYIVHWYANRARIASDSRRYQAMYAPESTAAPDGTAVPESAAAPDGTAAPEGTDAPEIAAASATARQPAGTGPEAQATGAAEASKGAALETTAAGPSTAEPTTAAAPSTHAALFLSAMPTLTAPPTSIPQPPSTKAPAGEIKAPARGEPAASLPAKPDAAAASSGAADDSAVSTTATEPAATPATAVAPTIKPTAPPTTAAEPSPAVTFKSSAAPSDVAPRTETARPGPTDASAVAPKASSTAAPDPTLETNPIVVDEPIATANADTLVLALPTPPPVQASFETLLAHNPDTVGFLDIEDLLSLPVVQRENDNDFYLNHNFDGRQSAEGTLFLDGVNRLVPEDDCLIVYGHNMKNGAMFGQLQRYSDAEFWKTHAVVKFDTLYESRSYVPFAAFTASMEPQDAHYFDIRRFLFDADGFERFVGDLQRLSLCAVPVNVRYGDRLLLLVTCEYTNNQGRFILALRQVRAGEDEDALRAVIQNAK